MTRSTYAHQKAWRIRHRDRYRAQRRVNYAVATGRLTRPEVCLVCGRQGRIEAHHPDYSQPLVVAWLCRLCHLEVS